MNMRSAKTRKLGTTVACGLAMLLLAMGALSVGCADAKQGSAGQQSASVSSGKQGYTGPLRVAVQYNALSLPTVYADANDLFSEAGIDVELYTFVNGAEENKAIEKGEVDIASDGLASVYMLASGGFRWIGESDTGSATVGIYIREGSAPALVSGQLESNPDVLGSADTLRGLTVVGPAGTMEEWAAVSYFSQFGLEAGKDYEFIEMDRSEAVDSVISGTADIFVATDVDYCRIMDEAGFVPLATGSEATGVPFNNGYLVSNDVAESRYDELVSFLQAVYKAAETLNGNPELSNTFAYEYYKANGKPTTMEDVQRESQVRAFLVPADFTAPGYQLGSGVLDIGAFNEDIGALDAEQVANIQRSIDPSILEDAFGITVQPATL